MWWDAEGLPFFQGPNMLFANSNTPRIDQEECALLDSPNCLAMFCHSEWYRDLIAAQRGPNNKSEIVMWPYPIDPMPEGPLPAKYDLLIYAKNGHRPGLLEHLAELYPNHFQIHYGQYKREELFAAARQSRACAYLADDDHGPLALQEILLAGCPTVGVRTGAPFIEHGVTGYFVDRLPPGKQNASAHDDIDSLLRYEGAIERILCIDPFHTRLNAVSKFELTTIVEDLVQQIAILCRNVDTVRS